MLQLDEIRRRHARRAYERGMFLRALAVALPTIALAILAAWLGGAIGWTVAFGAALFVSTTLLVWRGMDFARGVRAGLVAGLLPFVAIATVHFGVAHGCRGGHCYSMCLPTCVAAGTFAGVAIGAFVARLAHPWWAGASAVVASALTGALVCAYLGVVGAGVLTVSVAAAAALVAALLRLLRRNRSASGT